VVCIFAQTPISWVKIILETSEIW